MKFRKVLTSFVIMIFTLLLVTGCGCDNATYTVTFNNGSGTATTQTVNKGEKVTQPATPTREGYEFLGWYLNDEKYDFSKPVTGEITLTAKWQKLENGEPTDNTETYTVSFDSDGGSSVVSQTVKSGEKASKPANPTKDGYEFSSWTYEGKKFDFSTAIDKNITLVATWTKKSASTVGNNSGSNSGTTTKPATNTNDDSKLAAAKKALASVNISSAEDKLPAKQGDCTVEWTRGLPATITRGKSDSNIELEAKITCGSKSETVAVKGVVKASKMSFTVAPDDNRVTSTLTFTNDEKSVSSGTFLINGVSMGTISGGTLKQVADAELTGSKTFTVKIGNTIYAATKK